MEKISVLICLLVVLFSSCHKQKYEYGVLTDPRDGKTYKTVEFADHEWMAENLRYEGNIELGTEYDTIGSPRRYYPNGSQSAVEEKGYLYNWKAAMNGAEASDENPSGVQGVCPDGWHLPSMLEWKSLKDELGDDSEYMKEFTLPTAGAYNGTFINYGNRLYFWSSSKVDSANAYFCTMYDLYGITDIADQGTGMSVRCVKN
ncbi:MAG: hypothetical protein J5709_06200 [Bacteroidales bacterium]|nr:hypothetical protein [Bacteroidales bacterium]